MNKKVIAIVAFIVAMAVSTSVYALNGNNSGDTAVTVKPIETSLGDDNSLNLITNPSNPWENNGGNASSSKGSNEENKATIKTKVASSNIINKAKSRIMEVHFVYYGVIVLKDGDINNCKFYIDGEEVTPSKVNKEGTIVKIELGKKDSRTLKVVKGSVEDTTTLRYR
ncbi:hypothetical protein [Clostridium sp.]|uniref:hypothetical protein n=1 Tax=Clostridium sp. TaxID=1506 RepID=UPI003464BA8A